MTNSLTDIPIPDRLPLARMNGSFVLSDKGGSPAQVQEILSWILTHRVVGLDIVLLTHLLVPGEREGLGTPIALGTDLWTYDPAMDEYLDVILSPDEMEAYLDLRSDSLISPRYEDCLFRLLQSGVKRGIIPEKVRQALGENVEGDPILVAQGMDPEPGQDGEILLHEWLRNHKGSTSTIDGKVYTVEKGEILAEKLPPQQGTLGYTVKGKPLELEMLDPDLPRGENTFIGEEGFTLYAAADGYLHYDPPELSVRKVLQYEGDVDFNVGEIRFNGPIIIEGDVRKGGRINGKSNVEIRGCVEGGDVFTAEGEISVWGGINGLDVSTLLAGGDIRAEYTQDAVIRCGGQLDVERYVSRCQVEASGPITINDNEGMVRGGSIWSETSIRSNIAGSTACTPTVLMVKRRLDPEEKENWERISAREEMLEHRQQKLRRRLDYLSMLDRRQRRLTTRHQQEAELLSEELISLAEEIMSIEDKKHALQSVSRDDGEVSEPYIEIADKIYPGVRFVIGDKELLVREELPGGRVELLNGQIFLRQHSGKMHFDNRPSI